MKSSEFAKFLRDFDTLLASTGNQGAPTGITVIRDVLAEAGTKQVSATLKLLDGASFESTSYFRSSRMGDAIDQLKAIRDFTRLYSKKTIADDVARVLQFCDAHRDADANKFADVAKIALIEKPRAPSRRVSKTPNASDADIERYLERLNKTYGFEPNFDRVFAELKADATMKAPQLKKLAKLFTKLPAKSAPDGLKNIYRVHSEIIEADRHKAAVGGRVG